MELAESQIDEGQPTGDLESQGQTTNEETGGKTTGVEGLPEDWTPETLADRFKDYTSLQTEFGKRNETMKELESNLATYGGADQILQWAQWLDSNPRFAEWVEAERNRETVGEDFDNLDSEAKQALELVNKISESKVEKAIQERVAPIEERYKTEMIQNHFKNLSQKYENFDEMRDTMHELASELPLEVQDNPSEKDIEGLYIKALIETGKIEDFGAKVYEKKLQTVKKQSSDPVKPKSSVGAIKQAASIAEAMAAAKEQLGG